MTTTCHLNPDVQFGQHVLVARTDAAIAWADSHSLQLVDCSTRRVRWLPDSALDPDGLCLLVDDAMGAGLLALPLISYAE